MIICFLLIFRRFVAIFSMNNRNNGNIRNQIRYRIYRPIYLVGHARCATEQNVRIKERWLHKPNYL